MPCVHPIPLSKRAALAVLAVLAADLMAASPASATTSDNAIGIGFQGMWLAGPIGAVTGEWLHRLAGPLHTGVTGWAGHGSALAGFLGGTLSGRWDLSPEMDWGIGLTLGGGGAVSVVGFRPQDGLKAQFVTTQAAATRRADGAFFGIEPSLRLGFMTGIGTWMELHAGYFIGTSAGMNGPAVGLRILSRPERTN